MNKPNPQIPPVPAEPERSARAIRTSRPLVAASVPCESEQLLRSYFDSPGAMRGVVEVVGEDILHRSDNAVSAAYFRRSQKSMKDRFASELGMSHETIQLWIGHYLDSLRSGQAVTFEYCRTVEGTATWLAATVSPLGISSTGHPRFAYVVWDITKEKQQEQALHESEMRLRAILDYAADAIITIDEAGIVQTFNKAAEHIFGYTPAEIIGANINKLMPEPHRAAHDGYMRRYLATGLPNVIGIGRELQGQRKDGARVPIFLNVSAVMLSGKRYFTGVVRDLTQEKLALAERRAREQQAMQSQKVEALSVLAGGIAHDFNNILTSILGYADVAQSFSNEPPKVENALKRIVAGGERARDLVKQLLAFSQMGIDCRDDVDLRMSIQQALQLLQAAKPEGVTVKCVLSSVPVVVMADAVQMNQVVMNLCTNAFQAMNAGGELKINLDARTITDAAELPDTRVTPGRYACMTICDSGTGMTEELQKRIFEPFFTTRGIKSSGLGLSVVHGIVKKHNGTMKVKSQPGVGSSFIIWIPLKSEELPPAAPVASGKGADLGGGLMLLIDDDLAVLSFEKDVLTDLGFQVEACSNPEQALALIQADPHRFRFIVSDFNMPGMNGIELTDRIRQVNSVVPILIASGREDPCVTAHIRVTPGNLALLPKPFLRKEMQVALERILAGSKS